MSLLTHLLHLTVFLVFITASPPSTAAADSPTVYEALQSYGFPVGLLPVGVTKYKVDKATGKFSVHLNEACSFSIHGYDLKYKTTITGTISENKIKDLKGIQVKVLLFWVNIIEVTKDGNQLELSVGIASADFAVDNFYESPQCGCGFDCVNRHRGERSGGELSFKKLLVPLFQV